MSEEKISKRLRVPRASIPYVALTRARQALAGETQLGFDAHASMFDPDVVSFAHGEGVRRPYPQALAAMAEALHDPHGAPLENYMFLRRFQPLEAAITADMVSIGVPQQYAQNVILDAGTTRLLVAALDLMTLPGDMVISFAGFYHPLAAWCAYRDLDFRVIPAVAEEGYRPSATRLASFLSQNPTTRPPILVLFNPSMTGVVCTETEITELAQVIQRFDLWAIEDALFASCAFEQRAPKFRLAATVAAACVLTVSGASKLHGLANMRIGWGCGEAQLVADLQAFVTSSSASISHLAKIAALEALCAPERFKLRNVDEARLRTELIAETVVAINARLCAEFDRKVALVSVAHLPAAGHSLLLDFGGFADAACANGTRLTDSADLCRFFLAEGKVAFSPAQSHGFSGFHLRLNTVSVGTNFTYAPSISVEDEWLGMWTPQHEAAFEPAFAEGRALIVAALSDRMEPAMRKALAAGGNRSTSSSSFMRPRTSVVAVAGVNEAVRGCDVVLMDIWGVLTDGVRLLEGAYDVLNRLAKADIPVLLISNTSRLSHGVSATLDVLGIPSELYTAIVTGGELARRSIQERRIANREIGLHAYILGEQPGGHWAQEAGLKEVKDINFADLVLGVGVLKGSSIEEEHLAILRHAARRKLPFVVSNADAAVRLGDQLVAGVGALAPLYRDMGGEAYVFGKPHRQIFDFALGLAKEGSVPSHRVLVVGDSLETDIRGGAALGARTLLITGAGVHGAELHGMARNTAKEELQRLCAHHAVWPDMMLGALKW